MPQRENPSSSHSPLEEVWLDAAERCQPLGATLELTWRCNLRCAYCYVVNRDTRELSVDEWTGVLAQLRDLGTLNLTVTGGEPALYLGFTDVLAEANSMGFVVVVKSGGGLPPSKLLNALTGASKPFLLELSLHGATGEVHEKQTRAKGSFERLLATVREALERDIRVRLVCTVTRWNEHQLGEIVELAESLGVPLRLSAELAPCDDGDRQPLELMVSQEGYLRMKELVSDSGDVGKGNPSYVCGAARTGLAIAPNGTVYPCVQWRVAAGNVRELPLAEIWESPTMKRVRTLTKEAVIRLGREPWARRFCPGLAEILVGDPLGEYRHLAHPLHPLRVPYGKAGERG